LQVRALPRQPERDRQGVAGDPSFIILTGQPILLGAAFDIRAMSHHCNVAAAILAAGLGKRMHSDMPKALIELGGRPIVQHVLASVVEAGVDNIVVVTGHRGGSVQQAIGNDVRYAVQECQRGTADALMCAREALRGFHGQLLTLYCDVPFVPSALLRRLAHECTAHGAAAAMVTVELEDPGAYGRIIRDQDRRVVGIKETAGASAIELAIKEVNAGIYCFQAPLIFEIVSEIEPDPVKNELYLTDAIGILARKCFPISVVKVDDPAVVMGINTRDELEQAERALRRMAS
jgi:bifunctional UDP-N-acetylglucosamine pyrophosphorylase/glucosamine-1-phosphate N-acetyltransferase